MGECVCVCVCVVLFCFILVHLSLFFICAHLFSKEKKKTQYIE